MRNCNIERAVKFALMTAGSVVGVAGQIAMAQDQEQELEQVIVTGSRIPQPNLEGTSPVSVIGAQDITYQGTQQVEDLINNLPQVFASQGGNYSNGATGTATVNLRGLGAARTMVLINGRRMVAGTPRGTDNAPDLNQIPAPLIERVEVLTGGASAVYGSDAVAGVVNFIMKDDFEGIQLDGNYSFYQHDNSNDVADIAVGSIAAESPNSVGNDGDSIELSLQMGSNFADDKGNATLYVGWRKTDPLLQSERDYSACTLGSHPSYYDGEGFYCSGSGTAYPGWFNTDFGNFTVADELGNVRDMTFCADCYNFGPANYWQRPDERWSVSAFMHYDMSEAAQAYAEFMFSDDRTKSQIAPSGLFAFTFVDVPCDGANPLVSAAWLDAICGPDVGSATTHEVGIGRRNVEGGGRIDDIRHTSYRGVLGLKGDVWNNWNYDVSATYSTVVFSETYQNDFSITRGGRAMDVVADDTGQPVCRSVLDGTDPTCVPYDIWRIGGVTQEALDYLEMPLFSKGDTTLKTVQATLATDLGEYGAKLPTATDGIGVAFGVGYYENGLSYDVDPNFASGDGAGQGGPTTGQTGGYNAIEGFVEFRVPLLQDMFLADSLLLNASYRYSDYSAPIEDSTDTYGVGLEWAPIQALKFRGSYQHAVRAPTVVELFAAQALGLYDNDEDPCATDTPSATLEQCALTGVTAAQYGTIDDNPAGQYNALFGGNTDLIPETADSYTAGVVIQPDWLGGVSLAVDYFDITVEDVISTIIPTLTLNQCLESGEAVFCDKVHRDSRGTLWAESTAFIESLNLNVGKLQTSGVDVELAIASDVGGFGSLAFRLNGTWVNELITEPIAGSGTIGEYDCVGFYGPSCLTPTPEWRHTARVTWTTPWNWDLSLAWRHFDSVTLDALNESDLISGPFNPIDEELASQDYLDLAGSWTFLESYTMRLGINNLMDDDPPLSAQVGAGAGNGNTYPQVYDALGRYVFVGLTAKF